MLKIKNSLLLVSLFCFLVQVASAQKADTVRITPKSINTKLLKEGTHRYLIYFKLNKDSVRTQTQFWTRTITRSIYNGKESIEINQIWEDKDSIMHIVESISDAKTMEPLFHKTWWKVQAVRNSTIKTVTETSVDFINRTLTYNGKQLSDNDTSKQVKPIWNAFKSSIGKYYLNWHLDLETFPVLPYKKGVTFIIPFYDPGTASNYQELTYTVIGSGLLSGFNNQKIDCWLLQHESKGNKELFWISKKTREVLKLEQELNGRFYRYKIKLGFSS